MKQYLFVALLVGVFLAGCSDTLTDANPDAALEAPASKGSSYVAEYEVAVRNITKGQPLTPPVTAIHNQYVNLFDVGKEASFQIKEIAENGNLDPMIDYLSNNDNVSEVVVAVAGDPPPILSRQTVKFRIKAKAGHRYISFASMLICTNDGFTGVDAQKLPRRVGEWKQFNLTGYDAGTEKNTEDFADIVPPCQGLVGISSDDEGTGMSNPALAENGVITKHLGVEGGNDLVARVHGWRNPVAKVRVRRIK